MTELVKPPFSSATARMLLALPPEDLLPAAAIFSAATPPFLLPAAAFSPALALLPLPVFSAPLLAATFLPELPFLLPEALALAAFVLSPCFISVLGFAW